MGITRFEPTRSGAEPQSRESRSTTRENPIAELATHRTRSEVVRLDSSSRHRDLLAKAGRNVEFHVNGPKVTRPFHSRSAAAPSPWVFAPLGIALLSAIAFLVVVALRRRTGLAPTESEPTWAEAPSLEAARVDFTFERCECGSALSEADVQFTEVSLGGQTFHAARVDCRHCQHRRVGYFAILRRD